MSGPSLNEILHGCNSFSERLSLEQEASELVAVSSHKKKMRDLYNEIAGWCVVGDDHLDLSEHNVLPEFFMPWYPGMVHMLFLERKGWFPLAGMHIKLCEAGRFDNRFAAYEYLGRGERPIALASSARFWGLLVWSDTEQDKARLKAMREKEQNENT